MEKKLNRTKGKFVRGIRVDILPDCTEEEKTRIIEKIVRAYFEKYWMPDVDCIVSISPNGKNGMHRIRVELDVFAGSGLRVFAIENHRKILKELQDGGMNNVGLLQDDVIFYTKAGLANFRVLRIGYLAVTKIHGREHDIAMHDVVNVFRERYAQWFMGELDAQHSETTDELLAKLVAGKIHAALCLKELVPMQPALLEKGIECGGEFLVEGDCFTYLKKVMFDKKT